MTELHSNIPTVIAIVGPTASGKTAVSLSIAEQLNAEVIACDSRTVYRHFDIGTAKPTRAELQRIPHHLIDVAEPDEDFTVAHFTEQANSAIRKIVEKGKLPIVCGGTGFYARALLEGLVIPAVAPNAELRSRLQAFADEHGNQKLHERLSAVDPESAAKLNSNDRFRVIRALEVYETLGQPLSKVATKEKPPYKTVWVGLTFNDRALLHNNIKLRFDQQVEAGLVAETEALYKRYGASQKLLHTVNYKELVQLIEGHVDQEKAFEEAIRRNVQLARRQLIWFRANQQIQWFHCDAATKTELTQAVSTYIKGSI